eukprot:1159740-Pelagomonas_calceolata.AAC.6
MCEWRGRVGLQLTFCTHFSAAGSAHPESGLHGDVPVRKRDKSTRIGGGASVVVLVAAYTFCSNWWRTQI